jgi:hypothetical protein
MAIYTSVEEGVADLVPLSNKMIRSQWYLKKEEMEALKKWASSIVKEKGKRTTFVYDRKYIKIMIETWDCNFTGSLVGNWHMGTDLSGYRKSFIDDIPDWFEPSSNRPKGILFNGRGVMSVIE